MIRGVRVLDKWIRILRVLGVGEYIEFEGVLLCSRRDGGGDVFTTNSHS